jgi:hypothetical protein
MIFFLFLGFATFSASNADGGFADMRSFENFLPLDFPADLFAIMTSI